MLRVHIFDHLILTGTEHFFPFQEEVVKFFNLMDKAEKIYKKKLSRKQNQFGKNNTDWRNAKLNEPDDDTTDTEDEDDNQDTNKFLSLMENAKKRNSKVSIKWSAGQLKVEKFNDGFEGEIARREQEKKEVLMKKQLERRRLVQKVRKEPQSGGKRKFEDIF